MRTLCLVILSGITAIIDMVGIHGGVYFRTNYLEYLGKATCLYVFFGIGYQTLSWIVRQDNNQQIEMGGADQGFLKNFFIMFSCWIPYFIIFCPGVIQWDSMVQINDFFDGYSSFIYAEGGYIEVTALLNDHHPVFDTLIYGLFVEIGNILGNSNIGVALYSLTQMSLFSVSLAFFINQMKKEGLSVRWEKYIVLFFALFPFWGIWSVTMVKDTLFTIVFVMYMSTYISIVKNKKFEYGSLRCLLLWSFLMALTKKTGMYIVLFSNLGLLAGMRKGKLKILLSAFAPCVFVITVMQNILFPAFNIYPGGKQEALSTMFMQTARIVIDYKDELSETDIEIIDGVLRYEGLEKAYLDYNGSYSQNVKALIRHDHTRKAFFEYLKLWAKLGIKHPWTYVKTVILTAGTFFNSYSDIEPYYTTRAMGDDSYSNIDEWTLTDSLRGSVKNVMSWLYNMPVFNLLFKKALYIVWIPVFCMSETFKKKKMDIFIYLPIVLSIFILFLSPCGVTRYALPVMVVAPLMLAYCSIDTSIITAVNEYGKDIRYEPVDV